MKRPAAPLRYAVNWYKKDNSVAIRREHGDRHQFVSVRKRFWSESALRKLSERGISMLARGSSESEVAHFLRASVTRDLVPDDDDR